VTEGYEVFGRHDFSTDLDFVRVEDLDRGGQLVVEQEAGSEECIIVIDGAVQLDQADESTPVDGNSVALVRLDAAYRITGAGPVRLVRARVRQTATLADAGPDAVRVGRLDRTYSP